MSNVRDVIVRKHSELAILPKYAKHCPCGHVKPHTLTCVRMDASSFFSNAIMTRGIKNLCQLVKRVQTKFDCNAVSIDPGPKCSGKLIKVNGIPSQRNIILFKEIIQAFQLASKENKFTVGEFVFERHHGWPMGGSHSEPGTMIDVGEFVAEMHSPDNYYSKFYWCIENLPLTALLQGVQHVDDILLMSQVWCSNCINKKITGYMPPDMGFEIEEQGSHLRFLTTWISTLGTEIIVEPYQPNFDHFFKPKTPWKVFRCPQFIDRWHTPITMLRSFMFAHIFAYSNICSGSFASMKKHIAILCLECLCCDWEIQALHHVLVARSLRHRSENLEICHQFGRDIVKCLSLQQAFSYLETHF